MAEITLKGNPIHTSGELPAVGSKAPDFDLAASDLSRASLATFTGKRKLLNIVPSLDTPTCAASTRRFNEEAGRTDNAVVLVVSADLPFAQQRFCSTEGIEGVTVLSLMNSRKFAEDYGVLIQDGPLAGITARAVLVLDADDRVVYAQLVPEIGQEPDYDAALAALSSA